MREILLDGNWRLRADRIEENRFGVKKGMEWDMLIPGDVHDTLIKNKALPDPYYGTNELDILSIGRGDWTIEREFEYTKSEEKTFLHLEKVDTVASLFINGREVGSFENEHHIHFLDITAFLLEGKNTITFSFRSAESLALERNKTLPYPIPCSRYPNDSPNRNLVRKTQCNAGWDWGPCIMTIGIHESVKLIETTDYLFKDFAVISSLNNGVWNTQFELYIEAFRDKKVAASALVAGERVSTELSLKKGSHKYLITVPVADSSIERWWPNGCGEQKLYEAEISLPGERKTRLTAFRTLEIKNNITMGGKELTVSVNGRNIFMKGANWIPLDAIPGRMTRKRYEERIDDAAKANMNMLRVWGGGWYEKEDFYDICDKKGILLFHDMMFACSTYPSQKWFLDSVERELRDQIRRIKSHVSIALYCGNNEDLGALTWYEESIKNRERYLKDYSKLNDETVGRVVMEEDPSRTFWPSSPCAGPGDFSDNWHSDGNGDMHFWSVWHEGKDFDFYHSVKPRFCSEFGYQSFSSKSVVETFCPPDQMSLTSPVMLHHQKNTRGNEIMMEQFTRSFRYPSSFENALYLSLVQQALAIETAVVYWRSLMPYCMGTLIWQLNDVWPVASWSSVEYNGKWKPLQYAAKHFYAPVAPLIYKDDDTIFVKAANDSLSPRSVEVRVRVMDYSGRLIEERKDHITIESMTVSEVATFNTRDYDKGNTFVIAEVAREGRTEEASLLMDRVKNSSLQESFLSIVRLEENSDESFTLTLRAKKPAFYVVLDSGREEGFFSDNFLTLLPGEDKEVVFTPKKKIDKRALEAELTVKDIYHI